MQGLEADSIEAVARAEMQLASNRESEEVEKIRDNLQKAIKDAESDGEDEGESEKRKLIAAELRNAWRQQDIDEEDEKADAGKYVGGKGEEHADGKDNGATGALYWEEESEEENQTASIAF